VARLPVPNSKSDSDDSRDNSRDARPDMPAVRQNVTLVPSTKASGSPFSRWNNRICEYNDLSPGLGLGK